MREYQSPDHRVDAKVLDTFLGRQIRGLTVELRPSMDAARHGVSRPVKMRRGYYEAMIHNDINHPNIIGDSIAKPLIYFLEQEGLQVYPEQLDEDHLGSYDGRSIRYRSELRGILRASVIAHEAAHHFGKHIPYEPSDDGQEAIAESAALIALRFFYVDTASISLPDIARAIAGTGQTNGFSLWSPDEDGLPSGMVQAAEAARKILLAIAEVREFLGILNI